MSKLSLEPGEEILFTCGAGLGARPPRRFLGAGRLWLTTRRLEWKRDAISFPFPFPAPKIFSWSLDELDEVTPSLTLFGLYGRLLVRVGDQTFSFGPHKWTGASEIFTSGSLCKHIAGLSHEHRA